MARPASKYPTELELEILKVIWHSGPGTVREVRDALAAGSRDLAYTSVMTMMNIMVDKGYLARKKSGNSFTYRAKVTESSISGGMLHDLVKRVFGGSAKAVMVNLLETEDLDEKNIRELRDLLDTKAEETD